MKVEQFIWTAPNGWSAGFPGSLGHSAQLILIFGATAKLRDGQLVADLRSSFPASLLLGCSTAGEIAGTRVLDGSLVAVSVAFEHVDLVAAEIELASCIDSRDAGRRLVRCLDPHGLSHVLVISDGLKVNGSELVKGMTELLPPQTLVTGGLAGDGGAFEQTLVCSNSGAQDGKVAAIGFYGDRLHIGCASMGGWSAFGPHRVISRSRANVLYELDGRSALELYKTYLGEHAAQLPASGLLFPLSIHDEQGNSGVVRTILSIDEAKQSLTFAGDVPQGAHAQLMCANVERLVDGAEQAAVRTLQTNGPMSPDLAILISCVGRKLVLKQRVEEEIEVVRDALGSATTLCGFYSYGEICPFKRPEKSQLHNQTMTITTFAEH